MQDLRLLTVLVGLPGSGKTSFTKEVKDGPSGRDICIIHTDEIKDKYCWGNRYTMHDYIRKGMESWGNQSQIVLDGLFLTNDDILRAILDVASYTTRGFNVIIHRWDEDRETCLKNDGGRREVKSTRTIMEAQYDIIDVDWINERLVNHEVVVSKVINHEVMLKPDWFRYFKTQVDIYQDGKLKSEKWSIGGCHGNCWNSSVRYSDGDEPLEFTILDDLLDEKCPDLRYRHYRQIRKECVTTEETSESEYYGGYTNYLNWVCDLQKLYKMLKEFGYNVNYSAIE